MIDVHAHVVFRQFDVDRRAVIERARAAGVRWVEIGTDLAQSRAALLLAEQYPDLVIGATVGVHPSDVGPAADPDGLTQYDWQVISNLLQHQQTVAVGEVGFDFYHAWPGFSAAEQQALQHKTLQQFIQLASERKLPMVFHVRSGQGRDAHAALIDLLSGYPAGERPRGVIHTFSGTAEQAEAYLQLGMFLSFSGVVTFKNAGVIAEVARTMPLAKMLIETDCPFLAPEPYRGQRNEPAYVQLVAESIAARRGVPATELASHTVDNAWRFFSR